jgi:hypothetical protein
VLGFSVRKRKIFDSPPRLTENPSTIKKSPNIPQI